MDGQPIVSYVLVGTDVVVANQTKSGCAWRSHA